MNLVATLATSLMIRAADSQQLSGTATKAPASDFYLGLVVAVMALVGIGILIVRVIKWHRTRSRLPLLRAEIEQMRRRFRGAA